MAEIYLHQRNVGLGNPAYGWKRRRKRSTCMPRSFGVHRRAGSQSGDFADDELDQDLRSTFPSSLETEEFLGLSRKLQEIQSSHRKFPKKIKKLVALERSVAKIVAKSLKKNILNHLEIVL